MSRLFTVENLENSYKLLFDYQGSLDRKIKISQAEIGKNTEELLIVEGKLRLLKEQLDFMNSDADPEYTDNVVEFPKGE